MSLVFYLPGALLERNVSPCQNSRKCHAHTWYIYVGDARPSNLGALSQLMFKWTHGADAIVLVFFLEQLAYDDTGKMQPNSDSTSSFYFVNTL